MDNNECDPEDGETSLHECDPEKCEDSRARVSAPKVKDLLPGFTAFLRAQKRKPVSVYFARVKPVESVEAREAREAAKRAKLEAMHQTLLRHSAFLLSCVSCGLGDRKTWDALTARCVPTAEAARCAVGVVQAMHTAGPQCLAALYDITLGESASVTQRLCETIVKMAKITPEETVIDPFCGDGRMLIAANTYLQQNFKSGVQSPKVFGFLSNSGVPVAEMHLTVMGLSPEVLLHNFSGAPLLSKRTKGLPPADGTADVVVSRVTELPGWMSASDMLPPYKCKMATFDDSGFSYNFRKVPRATQPPKEAESLARFAVYRALELLRPGGRAVLLVPAALKQNKGDRLRDIRKSLAPHWYALESLPDTICTEAGQPLSLLCLRKQE